VRKSRDKLADGPSRKASPMPRVECVRSGLVVDRKFTAGFSHGRTGGSDEVTRRVTRCGRGGDARSCGYRGRSLRHCVAIRHRRCGVASCERPTCGARRTSASAAGEGVHGSIYGGGLPTRTRIADGGAPSCGSGGVVYGQRCPMPAHTRCDDGIANVGYPSAANRSRPPQDRAGVLRRLQRIRVRPTVDDLLDRVAQRWSQP
jgi:hypothetical protein